MEDSFRVRLDKAFGSLAYFPSSCTTSTAPPSSSPSSLWCLTDDEIHRNPWNRDKEKSEPESEADLGFKADMIKDLEDIDDEEEEQEKDNEESRCKLKPADYNDEEWVIKNSLGLDCTLEYEKEDEYDKVALCKEKPGNCLFMSNVTDYGIDIDSGTALPNSFKDVARDPRANIMAAKIRLKEDAEAARKLDSLWVVEKDSSSVVDEQIYLSDYGKRKDDLSDSKLQGIQSDLNSEKRVRFDPGCIDGRHKESFSVKDKQLEADSADDALVYPLPPDYPSGIPDYMQNPSKYTCYTFDLASDADEESNRQAYLDFFEKLKKSNAMESGLDDPSFISLMPVAYIPKRKNGDTVMVDDIFQLNQNGVGSHKESIHRRGLPLGIAAGDLHGGETCSMEVDEPEMVNDRKHRSGRQYRVREKFEGA